MIKSFVKNYWRYGIIIVFFLVVFLIFTVRLFSLQVVQGEELREKSQNQYIGRSADYFDRGNIYFTDKNGVKIAAATLQNGYKISINPKIITNPEDVYNNLSPLLNLEEDDYLAKAFEKDATYRELQKRVSPEISDKIIELSLEGVNVHKEKWRYYPGNNLASHIIGFLSYKGDDLKALYGLERYYDSVLEKRNQKQFNNFFAEIFSGLNKVVVEGKSMTGSIVTTIEPSVQSFVEEELAKTKNDWASKKTGAIVMDPRTGEIYAMAINPSFDVNNFNKVDDISVLNNDLIESVYEMGSIVKPLSVAIGLDTGVIRPDSTYEDKGSMTLDQKTFYNYDHKARGVVSMQEVLNQSLNTGVAYISLQVGRTKFKEYLTKLIGDKTNIDLPNEVNPIIKNLDNNRDIEFATASFGQGIAMSPISITRALASLGNGGYLVTPHLLKEYDYDIGLKKTYEPPAPVQIFKTETSEEITRMLIKVVDDALRGGEESLANYSIAAKTGTAQIANPSSGGYYEDRYMHTFFGYFPAYDPKFIVFLFNLEPQGARYSSETLTAPFMNITKYLINYYSIPPDR